MGFNWIEDTANRYRRSGSNWMHDIGPEELQKGFFAIMRDIESGHFDFNKYMYVLLDDEFINESYNAATHKANDAFYRSWALSYFLDRVMAGEPDPYDIRSEASLIGLEHEAYQTWYKTIDAYRYTHDPNTIISGMDMIQTIGKRKKIIRDTMEINDKPAWVLWSQYKSTSPGAVDKFIRNLGKGKVPVTDIINDIIKTPGLLAKACAAAQKRFILHSEIESGMRKILDNNPMKPDPWVMSAYPGIKKSMTAYNIVKDKLYEISCMDPNSPIFKSTLIALKSILIKDYNGSL